MNGFDFLAVGEAQQPFARAVARGLRRRDLRPPQRIMLGKTLAKGLGEIGHRREVGHSAMVNPVPELPRSERLSAEFRHFGRELGAAKPDEITTPIASV